MSKFTEAIERELEGLEHVHVGYARGCTECPAEQEDKIVCDDEGYFSWSPCGCCCSTLGGTRYAAHGRMADGTLVHFDVCEDCLMYLANGDEPENWDSGS